MKKLYPFNPDWEHEIPPCASIYEKMHESQSFTNEILAARMGLPLKLTNKLLKSEVPITAAIAKKLEDVFDVPASFWLNLEHNYRAALNQNNYRAALNQKMLEDCSIKGNGH